ncbi:bactofilin family protein [Cellulosilyticum sp. I15G10I2]|uniref:bactofilin family protein n=1 Tax=Cellulosilyticum sp. I15G10I2 TaxID=1892843 RepID=UPI00085BD6C2|nr:polymer-forming cytoskeletal protein [Cellulosilyticum sp. I15G10I2]
MFGDLKGTSKEQQKLVRTDVGTLIDTTASLKGDIVTEGNLRIDGKFEGNIIQARDVVVGEGGFIQGEVNCETMVIYGTVKGNIKCQGLVEIAPVGKVFGDMEVKSISIKEGAVFEGKSIMNQNQTQLEIE